MVVVTHDGTVLTYDITTLAGNLANGVHAARRVASSRRTPFPIRRLYTSTNPNEERAFESLSWSAVDGYKAGEFPAVLASGPGWFVLDAPPGTTLTQLWSKCGGHMPKTLVARIGRQGRRLLRKTHVAGFLIRNLSMESFVYRQGRLYLVDLFMHKMLAATLRPRPPRENGAWVNAFSSVHAQHHHPNVEDDFIALANILALLRVGSTPSARAPPQVWRQEYLLLSATYGVDVAAVSGPKGMRRRMFLGPASSVLATFRALHDADAALFPPVTPDGILTCPIGRTLEEARARHVSTHGLQVQGLVLLAGVHATGRVLRNVSTTSFALHDGRLYLVDVSMAKKVRGKDAAKACRLPTACPWVNCFSTERVRQGHAPLYEDDYAAFRSVIRYVAEEEKVQAVPAPEEVHTAPEVRRATAEVSEWTAVTAFLTVFLGVAILMALVALFCSYTPTVRLYL